MGACTRNMGRKRDSWHGLTVVTLADGQLGSEGREEGNMYGKAKEVSLLPSPSSIVPVCRGGCPASPPHAWSQKVSGWRVNETLLRARGG